MLQLVVAIGVLLTVYLLGSISFAKIAERLFIRDKRLENFGSGNLGALNVFRATKNPVVAALVALGDAFKGIVAVKLASKFLQAPGAMFLAGFLVVAGHNWPFWNHFRGGRGIATFLGILLYKNPLAFLSWFFTWLIVYTLSKVIILGAVVALPTVIAVFYSQLPPEVFGAAVALSMGLGPKIKNMVEGREPKDYWRV